MFNLVAENIFVAEKKILCSKNAFKVFFVHRKNLLINFNRINTIQKDFRACLNPLITNVIFLKNFAKTTTKSYCKFTTVPSIDTLTRLSYSSIVCIANYELTSKTCILNNKQFNICMRKNNDSTTTVK